MEEQKDGQFKQNSKLYHVGDKVAHELEMAERQKVNKGNLQQNRGNPTDY